MKSKSNLGSNHQYLASCILPFNHCCEKMTKEILMRQ